MRRVASLAAFGALLFAGLTLLALEGTGMAVLQTASPDGATRTTRVWFAQDQGDLWVEAATEARPFLQDLASNPQVTLQLRDSPFSGDWRTVRGRAEVEPDPEGHAHIRALLAAKYGWADVWVGMLTDTSESKAVRVIVEAPPDAR